MLQDLRGRRLSAAPRELCHVTLPNSISNLQRQYWPGIARLSLYELVCPCYTAIRLNIWRSGRVRALQSFFFVGRPVWQ
jgi:hypothetical protein